MNKTLTAYFYKFLIILIVFVVRWSFSSYAQTLTTNYQGFSGCSGPIQLFVFDFTNTTSNTLTQTVSTSNADNQCCGLANNFGCSMFVIITDPNAVGVTFSTSGPCGNVNFYYENCGTTVTCGNTVCLNPGTNTHYFLMCRTGGPNYNFTFNQILAPEASPDIITAEDCSKTLTVTGLIPASIQWTSISPGAPGAYNSLLSCTSGCSTTIFTPIPGTPTSISYQVCGTVSGPCASATFCDTILVTTYPSLFAIPGPPVAICNGSVTGAPVIASVTGGTAPYTYTWSGPGGFSQVNTTSATTNTVTAMLPGTYTVTISDITGCPSSTTTINVASFNVDIVANAGPDITICRSPVPTITINGSVSATNSGIWTGGDGTYVNGATSLSLQYIPSAAELAAGSVTLTLTPTNTGGCPFTTDQVTIFLPQFTAGLSAVPTNITCNGLLNGSVDLTVTGGPAPFTYTWSNGSTSEDIASLGVGTYTVTVSDGNGCTGTASATITQPPLLTASSNVTTNFNGFGVSCFGSTNGAISVTPGGGSPGYTYVWNTGSTNEDLSGLPAGTYTVTATDINGCTITSSITLTEPPALTEAISAFQYPSGSNISCFGLSDGSTDVTIGGGSPGYTYVWNTGSTNEDLSGIPAGTYTVTATDINGCTITSCITLTEPPALTEAISAFQYPSGNNISCFGLSDGSTDITIGGGSPGYTYVWNTGSTNEDLSGLPAGTYTVTATDINGCTITSSITLTEPPALTEAISAFQYPSGSNISCFGLSDGSTDVTIGGGSPGYTYVWNTGSTNEDLSGLPAGTYTVTATDINGCTINSSITLTEPPALTEAISAFQYPSGSNISCFGLSDGSTDVTIGGGSPGYTYVWNTGSTNEDLSGLPAGTYTVTATDINGCTITSSITLTEPPALTEAISAFQYPSGSNISCFGLSDGSTDVTIGGGSPGYTYVWNTGSTNEDLSGLPAGTYTVTATDINGCTITSSITLTEPPALTEAISAFQYPSGSNISCFGLSDGSTDVTIGGGSPGYTYVWNTGSTNEDLSGLPAGIYTVTATDINGCTITSSITLTEPPALTEAISAFQYPSGSNISCFGLSDGSTDVTIGGGSPGYTYVWNTGSTNEDLSGIPAGTYTVTATDINGCTITSSITLTEPPALTEAISAFQYPSGSNISCFGLSDGSTDVTIGGGSPGYTYVWNTGSTNEDLSGIPAGTYTVTATDINGCTITSSITLTEPPALTEAISAFQYPSGSNISCFGLSDGSTDVTIGGGSPGYTYVWNTGSTNEDLSGLPAGTYTVTATDINGCTITSSITLVEPPALTEAISAFQYPSGSNISCFGLSDGSTDVTIGGGSPGYTYVWNTGSTNEDLSGLPAGTYTVTATDINGCTITSSITLVEPPALTEAISAFQYPSGSNISCFGLSDGSTDVTIGGGSPGYTYVWNTGSTNEDLSGLPAGTYTVTATDINGCTITSSITLTEPPALTEAISAFQYPSGSNISCFGLSDGSTDVTIGGGSPGYTYVWNTGSTNEDLSGLPAGTYTVTATDINGCTITSSITLTEPPALTEAISAFQYPSGSNISCFGLSDGSTDVTIGGGSPGYTYVWNTGSTNEDLSGLPAGTYTVTATDINGCTITSSITLTEPPALTEAISTFQYPSGSNISCFGLSDGSTDITIGGGSPGYTYVWNTGSTNEDLSGLPAGTYTVTATDINGCTITSSITLTEPPALTEAISAFQYPSGSNISCFGLSDGSTDVTIGGGSPGYTYVWNTGSTNEDLSGLPAGTYTVTATDINGCTITSSITLTEPPALTEAISAFQYPSGSNISCFGLSDGSTDVTIGGGSPGYTYVWNTGSTNEDLSGLPAGTYTVTATDINGCTITSSITLTEPPALTEAISAFQYPSGSNISCFGLSDGSTDVTIGGGSPGYTYVWNTGSTNEDLSGLPAGTYTVTATDINGCTITSSITLTEPPALTEAISAFQYPSGSNISCFGLSDGSTDVTIGGGSPGYTYVWNTGSTNEDLSGLPAGTYTVTATDINGCTITSSITLTEPPALTEAISTFQYPSGSNISCFGLSDGSTDITIGGGSPGYTYVWNTGSTNEDLSGLPAGTYTVTATDINGCTITSSITLTEPPALTEAISTFQYPSGSNISCFGLSDGSTDITIGGGSPGYTYVWNTGSTNEDLSGLPAGTYTVTATDINGCTISTSITLTEPPIITSSATIIDVLCFGNSTGAIDVTFNGGTPLFSFNWSNGQITEDLSNLTAGTYTVTATDQNGCTHSLSATITQPADSVTIDGIVSNVSCFNGSDGAINITVTGGTPGYSYQWSNGASSEDIGLLIAGTYTVTVTDASGCNYTNNIGFVVSQPSEPIQIIGVITNVSCFGGVNGGIDITVTGGTQPYNYVWSNGAISEDIVNITAGEYTVTVTDNQNCIETDNYAVTEPPLLVINANVSDNKCFGFTDASIDIEVVGGVPGYTYQWNIGATVPDLTNLAPGNYILTVTDANNCIGVGSFNIAAATEVNVQLVDTIIEIFITESATLIPQVSGGTGNYTYLWSPPDFISCTSCDVTTASPLYNMEYVLLVIDGNGCTDIAVVDIIVREELFIPNTFTPNGDGINDTFSAVSRLVQKYEMLIFNRWGELIYKTDKIDAGWNGLLNGRECPQGVYSYKINVKFWSGNVKEYVGHVNLLR
jgi:gliding motility-associated-like protein